MNLLESKACFTVQELYESKILPIGIHKLYELSKHPTFPAKRIGRKIIISSAGLKKWLADESQKYF